MLNWGFVVDDFGDEVQLMTVDPNKDKPFVVHPKHYNMGNIEVKDFIRDQKLGFSLGNAIKYICRAEHKEKKIQDLKKAIFYIQDEIDEQARFD